MNLKYFFLIGLNLFFYSKGKSQKQEIETVWRQVAPGMAGSNRAIFTDAVDANKIWLTPDMGNDYVSVDAGKHWESCIPINEVWTKRIPLSDECVVSDHKDNNIVLSLNKKQLVLSTDGGKNFKKITHFNKGKAPSSLWYSATPHPVEKGT